MVIGHSGLMIPLPKRHAEGTHRAEALAMTLARLLRCHPFGTSGIDNVPAALPADARWYVPWRYGKWSWRNAGD